MKDKDTFFTQTHCDRCKKLLGVSRKLSWFTEECLCSRCQDDEEALRSRLESKGVNTSDLEGCGYIPKEDT